MRVEDLKYLAGVVDSRGSLFCQKVLQPLGKNHNYLPLMGFSSINSERLKMLAKFYGIEPHNKMQLGKARTVDILKDIYPYLRFRKKMVYHLLQIEKIRTKTLRPSKDKRRKLPAIKAIKGTSRSLPKEALVEMDFHYRQFNKLRSYRDDGK